MQAYTHSLNTHVEFTRFEANEQAWQEQHIHPHIQPAFNTAAKPSAQPTTPSKKYATTATTHSQVSKGPATLNHQQQPRNNPNSDNSQLQKHNITSHVQHTNHKCAWQTRPTHTHTTRAQPEHEKLEQKERERQRDCPTQVGVPCTLTNMHMSSVPRTILIKSPPSANLFQGAECCVTCKSRPQQMQSLPVPLTLGFTPSVQWHAVSVLAIK